MDLPRRGFGRLVWSALLLLALTLSPATGRSDALVGLTHWDGPGVLVPNLGPGLEYYRLVAVAEVDRRAPVEGKYRLRLVLPDGQVETRTVPDHERNSRRLEVLIRTSAVRNLRPGQVVVRVSVLDASAGARVVDELRATIADFPRPMPVGATSDPGPFGWGEPLSRPAGPAGGARPLPRPGPDGLRFVRVPATGGLPGFFLATGEATNAQVAKRLEGYDPRAGRSDEFTLEDPAQPAVGLTANRAEGYLKALDKGDVSGLRYRLPTKAEWLAAARAGKPTSSWWGDDPAHPAGANFLGPEPALPADTTALALPATGTEGFAPNPWGLFHTFGNVAEWANADAGGPVRMGGHFRTEPTSTLPEVSVEDADTTGPDPYVGVRPAFDLTAEAGAGLIRKALAADARLADVAVAFDPDRATATLAGKLTDTSLRRVLDRRLKSLWFLAAVENRVESPTVAAGLLANLGTRVSHVRRIKPLDRRLIEVAVPVLWADPLPVRGSEWWVNVYPARGGHFAHRLIEAEPDSTGQVKVVIDQSRVADAGPPGVNGVSVALSLGAPAPGPTDPHVVSNVAKLPRNLP